VDRNGKVAVVVDEERCVGCGACAAVCPTGAMHSGNTSDPAVEAMLSAMDLVGKMVVFSCNWGAYTGPELAGIHRTPYAENVRLVRLMCASRIHAGLVLKAFAKGAAGVLMLACPPEGCHYQTDSRARFEQSVQLTGLLGIAPERLQLVYLEAGDLNGFLEIVNDFSDVVMAIRDEMQT
jgi:coenzyme F420-reducing hydrogenase delta subunit